MKFQNQLEMKVKSLRAAFSDLLETECRLKIVTKDGNISVISSELLRFISPFVNRVLNNVPCCTSSPIFIPDVSKASIDHVLNIIRTGITNLCSLSYKQIQEVKETARMLQIDLTNLSTVMVPDKISVTDQTLLSEECSKNVPKVEEKSYNNKDVPKVEDISEKDLPKVEDISDKDVPKVEDICYKDVPKVEDISDKDVPKVEDISDKDVPKYEGNYEDQLRLDRHKIKRRRSRWDVPPPPPTIIIKHETIKHEEIHGKVEIKTECPEYFEFHEDYETSGVRLEIKEEPTCKSENLLVHETLGTEQIKRESLDKTPSLRGDKEKNIDMNNDSAAQFFFVQALAAPPDSNAETEPSPSSSGTDEEFSSYPTTMDETPEVPTSSANQRPDAPSQSKKRKSQSQGKTNTKNARIEARAWKMEDEETIDNLDVNNCKNLAGGKENGTTSSLVLQNRLTTSWEFESLKMVKCPECNYNYRWLDKIGKHLENHHKKTIKDFALKCEFCFAFVSALDLESHMKAKHPAKCLVEKPGISKIGKVATNRGTVTNTGALHSVETDHGDLNPRSKIVQGWFHSDQVSYTRTDYNPQPQMDVIPSFLRYRGRMESIYFTRNPKVITSANAKSIYLFNELPEGLSENWKMRTFEVIKKGAKSMIKHYLTPELMVLKTDLAVVEYLRLKGEMGTEQLLEISRLLNIPEKKLKTNLHSEKNGIHPFTNKNKYI